MLTDEDGGDAMDMVAAYAAIPNVRSHLRTMLATSQTALLPLEQDRVKGADGEARGVLQERRERLILWRESFTTGVVRKFRGE